MGFGWDLEWWMLFFCFATVPQRIALKNLRVLTNEPVVSFFRKNTYLLALTCSLAHNFPIKPNFPAHIKKFPKNLKKGVDTSQAGARERGVVVIGGVSQTQRALTRSRAGARERGVRLHSPSNVRSDFSRSVRRAVGGTTAIMAVRGTTMCKDVIEDFEDGVDKFVLPGLSFSEITLISYQRDA